MTATGDSEEAVDALGTLFHTYRKPIDRYLVSLGVNHHEVEDRRQEVFEKLIKNRGLKSVDPRKGKFRTFLKETAKNHAINVRKKDGAAKRGGNSKPASLERETEKGREVDDQEALSPDEELDLNYARELYHSVMTRASKLENFKYIKQFLPKRCRFPRAVKERAAEAAGRSPTAFEHDIQNMRSAIGGYIDEEIERTLVAVPGIDIAKEREAEKAFLLALLYRGVDRNSRA